jgi:hypothetical protein
MFHVKQFLSCGLYPRNPGARCVALRRGGPARAAAAPGAAGARVKKRAMATCDSVKSADGSERARRMTGEEDLSLHAPRLVPAFAP